MDLPVAEQRWIDFSAVAGGGEAAPKAAEPERLLPKLITYDKSGAPVNAQDHKVEGEQVRADTQLPWREWHLSAAGQSLDEESSDIAAIMLALRALHTAPQLRDAPVDVLMTESKQKLVVASSDIKPACLELQPCVPKSGKAFAVSTNPYRVAIVVKRMRQTHHRLPGKAHANPEQIAYSEKTYYLHPEDEIPEVATVERDVAAANPGVLAWNWTGEEIMHQFWAVQRLTKEDLQKKIANEPQSRLPARFNVATAVADHNVVSIGKLNEKSVSLTLQVQVPMMTNEATIRKGEQLVMEHIAAAVAKKRKETTWKNKIVQLRPRPRPSRRVSRGAMEV